MGDSSELTFLPGGVAVDDRGSLQFVNDFDMADCGIRRFYAVTNHETLFIRAWHGHQNETKYLFVASGAVLLAAVKIDDWKNPSPSLPVARHVLSYEKPGLMKIPGGFAHGTMTLRPNTRLFFFSTSSLKESAGDDFRFEAFFWNPWKIEPR
ncbi:MAG: dTDP-4-dehydrorhamnose 3,5-epimerase family protein [Alphaproteobacteria bacterium]|nr:dTDP-4-dehydrorhamnose 3,5-epimerase family protein [Alphaproteobacteria bacterium]